MSLIYEKRLGSEVRITYDLLHHEHTWRTYVDRDINRTGAPLALAAPRLV
jgi:hypothetical protein